MKRESDDGGFDNNSGSPSVDKIDGGGLADGTVAKKPKNDDESDDQQLEVRLLIQTKAAGGIIGKGGENIKGLRAKYNCSITVPDSSAPERILTIVADQEEVLNCVNDIFPKLQEARNLTSNNENGDYENGTELEVRYLVHQSHAGAIIGRSGSKIKELREQTDTQMKVFGQPAPMSSDRIVQIIGEPSNVISAMRALVDLMRDLPIKGNGRPYDPSNYDLNFVYEYGGYIPDKGWRGGPNLGGVRHSSLQMGGHPNHMRGQLPPMRTGGPGAWNMGFNGSSSHHMDLHGGGGGGGSYGIGRGGGGARYGGAGGGMRGGNDGGGGGPAPLDWSNAAGRGGGPVQSTQVSIPSDLGGIIIGRNGERINRIRMDSGATIKLDPPDNDERIITISGNQNQIQMAQYLLQQCVRTSQAGRKYINSQGTHY